MIVVFVQRTLRLSNTDGYMISEIKDHPDTQRYVISWEDKWAPWDNHSARLQNKVRDCKIATTKPSPTNDQP